MSTKQDNSNDDDNAEQQNPISCKICFESGLEENLTTPCFCKGTIGRVHLSCLEKWLGMTNTNSCELCGFRFNLTRHVRYGVLYSIYYWLSTTKQALVDLILFLILLPTCFALMFTAMACSLTPNPNRLESRGYWPPLTATLTTIVIGSAFNLWFSAIVSNHSRTWYKFWQANSKVKIHNLKPIQPTQIFYSETSV